MNQLKEELVMENSIDFTEAFEAIKNNKHIESPLTDKEQYEFLADMLLSRKDKRKLLRYKGYKTFKNKYSK